MEHEITTHTEPAKKIVPASNSPAARSSPQPQHGAVRGETLDAITVVRLAGDGFLPSTAYEHHLHDSLGCRQPPLRILLHLSWCPIAKWYRASDKPQSLALRGISLPQGFRFETHRQSPGTQLRPGPEKRPSKARAPTGPPKARASRASKTCGLRKTRNKRGLA